MDPLAVAFEVDLRGGRGPAGQGDRLVLHDVHVVRLHQEVGQQVREGRRQRVRCRGDMLGVCNGEKMSNMKLSEGRKEGEIYSKNLNLYRSFVSSTFVYELISLGHFVKMDCCL